MKYFRKKYIDASLISIFLVGMLLISTLCSKSTIIDTPLPLAGGEIQAFYYLNVKGMSHAEVDYKQCYYVGKGTVIIEEISVKKESFIYNNRVNLSEGANDIVTNGLMQENGDVKNELPIEEGVDNPKSVELEDESNKVEVDSNDENDDVLDGNEIISDFEDELEFNKDFEEQQEEIGPDNSEETEIEEVIRVGKVPEYNGQYGDYIINWSYIYYSDGNYRVIGDVTPAPNRKVDKQAFYYLNNRGVDKSELDYRKCYYVGKGLVSEIIDFKGNMQDVETSLIPEYNGALGRINIEWDYIGYDNNSYRVIGEISEAENIQNEKIAFYYLNFKNIDSPASNYNKCYYLGKGTVFEEENYLGQIVDLLTGSIPSYNGQLGDIVINWSTIKLVNNNYRVIGEIRATEKQFDYDSIEDLKKAATLKVDDVVNTKGYRNAGDGGAAEYKIVDTTDLKPDDFMCIKLESGLFALLIVEDNKISANSFGAYGDGIHDEAPVIQKIIDMGYDVELSEGKTYKLISNGIYLKNSCEINGNGATIVVDDSYSPTNADFNYYMIRNEHGVVQDSVAIKNINLKVSFSNNRVMDREYVVISPLFIKNVSIDNIKIETSETNNCVDCLWVNNGCDSVSITNSRIENKTTGTTGGAVWLTSKNNGAEGFTAINKCIINNCYIYCSSADEPFAIWGPNGGNYTINNTVIEGNIKASGQTRVFSIFTQGNNGCVYNVNMNDCTVKTNCRKDVKTSFYDSVFGVGTDYGTNAINFNVTNCIITGTVYGSLLFPSTFRPDYIERFNGNNRLVKIKFNDCNINCDSTITGTGVNYYNTSANYPTCAWDCTFSNCDITCKTCFAFLYFASSKYYVPEIVLDNCEVKIVNAKAFILQQQEGAGAYVNIKDTSINADGVTTLVTIKNKKTKSVQLQKNSGMDMVVSNILLNGAKIQ